MSYAHETSAAPNEPPRFLSVLWMRLKRLWKPAHDGTLKEALEEALDEVLEEHENEATQIAPDETQMLRNVLHFGDRTVREIMIPRADIVAIAEGITFSKLKAHIVEQRHTRTPVYRGNIDQMIGFLHVKDMIQLEPDVHADEPFEFKPVLRSLLFVPHSMKLVDLLARMRSSKGHMAIVVDEHGGTDGLVTLEDVVEEIIGEIQDEHDEEELHAQVTRVGDHAIDCLARTRLDRLEATLDLRLMTPDDEGNFDTLGGLIFAELGRVPHQGERVPHPTGVVFEILEADARKIEKVRIHLQPPPAQTAESA